MIQRIQTVYLFLITVLAVVALCLPVGRFLQDGLLTAELYNLYIAPVKGEAVYAPWALFALLLVVAVSSFACIFLFKKRMLQVRMIIFNALLLIGYYIAYGVFAFILAKEWGTFALGWSACLPAVALILDYLAFRAVMKDEMIVRSLDRLR
jgi:hypothetical protein